MHLFNTDNVFYLWLVEHMGVKPTSNQSANWLRYKLETLMCRSPVLPSPLLSAPEQSTLLPSLTINRWWLKDEIPNELTVPGGFSFLCQPSLVIKRPHTQAFQEKTRFLTTCSSSSKVLQFSRACSRPSDIFPSFVSFWILLWTFLATSLKLKPYRIDSISMSNLPSQG